MIDEARPPETPSASAIVRFLEGLRDRPRVLYPLAGSLVAAVAVADYATGDQVLLYIAHLVPVGLLAWGGGFYAGLAGAVVSAGAVLVSYVAAAGALRTLHVWHAIVSFTSSAGVAAAVAGLRSSHDRVLALLDAERRLARQDPLTGIASARAFHERLADEVERMRRSGRPLSLLYLDLDDFKRVNDERGHVAGDVLLGRVARVIHAHVRRVDLCARLGGDEFGVLMPETDAAKARAVAGRVRDAIGASFAAGGASVSISAGLATFAEPPIDAQAPVGIVDGLMYEAKRQGKSRIVDRTFP